MTAVVLRIAALALLSALLLGAAPASTLPPVPSDSLYLVEGAFEDQDANKTTLAVERGQTTLMAMFYASCPMACPMLIADVKRVLGTLTDAERARVHVVLVSLDPKRDTVALLKKTFATRTLDDKLWTLLRTDDSTTRTLAAALGVRFRDNGDGSIDHTSRIVLLDGDGVVRATRDTIGAEPAPFADQIRAQLRHAAPAPSVPSAPPVR